VGFGKIEVATSGMREFDFQLHGFVEINFESHRVFCTLSMQLMMVGEPSAQVYKCTTQGAVSYRDSPCGPSVEKQQALNVDVNSERKLNEMRCFALKHYDVSGSNLEELSNRLQLNGLTVGYA
jgi:hypothetical protein